MYTLRKKFAHGRIYLLIAVSLSLTACGAIKETLGEKLENKAVDYKTSRDLPPLEVPPDLILPSGNDALEVPSGGSMTYSEYASGKRGTPQTAGHVVLPEFPDIRIVRDRDSHWLVIKGGPDHVWSKVRDFWLEAGFQLKREDPVIGIMETDWAENRADIPTGFIRSLLGKFADTVYSSATRDKFRVRLERGREEGTTELYLSHQGAEEVTQGNSFVWQSRPSDPGLEAEMLRRMIISFGMTKEKAKAILAEGEDRPDRAYLIRGRKGTTPILSVHERFSRAWRRTGLVLDRIGFTVEDRDRSRGLFYVRYVDPLADTEQEKAWLSKLRFWGKDKKPKDDEYLIRLREQTVVAEATAATHVEVLDKNGKPKQSSTAERILILLHEQLK
uniref:Beta-barrel assembly machine subunit BamC n=1 Tax=Candidatus Kentrum eta TaxID=2126337 RepID=A0A450VA07_9GAMM|nr:MAG: Beta-barrel assembly machine subunit BamC [Candidatus Kentron sp. H]VFK01613.1 MAG: Beta-barrel assembly machine subunit BamC [Candidatus Kentron sp. H]VFK05000.1 MAG: Beta-barrel assembly machine subunit BamC [Candidatus Kentron sp. H]